MSKKKYIETPELLYELFDKYKSKIHENPRYQYQLDKTGKVVPIPLKVPLTIEGFKVYCYNEIGSIKHYLENTDNAYEEYRPICMRIKEEIRQDQIEGGMVGQYNASITQRLNNLIDKQQHEVKMEQPLFPDID
jgi:hypothetical protein